MHLLGMEHGFGLSANSWSHCTYCGRCCVSCKMNGKTEVSVVFFGDGACEEGVVHESLNLAASMQLPIIFVAENNLFLANRIR